MGQLCHIGVGYQFGTYLLMECAVYVPYSCFFLQNTLAALAHGLTLLTGGSPNVRADPQPSIIDAVYVPLDLLSRILVLTSPSYFPRAQFSALFSNFLGLFNGTLSYLLTPAIQAFTGQLQGNLEPLLKVFGRATYIFFQQTSGLLYLLATDPPSK